MAVLPNQSSHALPKTFRFLLSDPKSEIIDFYPTNFKLDINGQRFAWMGVNLLPFIDRKRLLAAIKPLENTLTKSEKERNVLGDNLIYIELDNNS